MLFTKRESLTRREQKWLDAQRSAWLSIWVVESVEPGRRIGLRDRLTDERRKVLEARASKQLIAGHHVLARVVDFERHSYLCGMHPHPLSHPLANDLVDDIRTQLRADGHIRPASLRNLRVAALVTDLWSEAIEQKVGRGKRDSTLFNPEGDPIVLTIDHFTYSPADREAVTSAVRALPGAEAEDHDGVVLLQGDSIIANVFFSGTGMRIVSNSLHRANATRHRIEKTCGGLLQFRSREFELGLEMRF